MGYTVKITLGVTDKVATGKRYKDINMKGMYVSNNKKARHGDIQEAVTQKILNNLRSKHTDYDFTVKKILISAHKMDFVFSDGTQSAPVAQQ